MNRPVGGRGKQASYKSTHVRIPEPIKARVEELKELFFSGKLGERGHIALEMDEVYNEYINSLTGKTGEDNLDENDDYLSLEESIAIAQKLLKQKKSVKQTIAKLLTSIYGVEVDPKSL